MQSFHSGINRCKSHRSTPCADQRWRYTGRRLMYAQGRHNSHSAGLRARLNR